MNYEWAAPSAELDAEISRIIGEASFKRVSFVRINGRTYEGRFWMELDDLPSDPPSGYHTAFHPPTYSADMTLATKALEKAAAGRRFSIEYDVDYGIDKKTGWNVSIDGCCWNIFAETGPLAICIAIVKFVGAVDNLAGNAHVG